MDPVFDALFLGIDLSTQKLKAVILNSCLVIVDELIVDFDADLPHFNTKNGVLHGKDGLSVTSPVLMWVQAMDMLLEKLNKSVVDVSKIVAIGGCGQQHGTVYLNKGFSGILHDISPLETFYDSLKGSFSVLNSPIWMDNSTREYCDLMEDIIGGPEKLSILTGSRAYPRFSVHHINKLAQDDREVYDNTEKVCLVSNFVASLFIGQYAPIDFSDGSGMNLLDITKKCWVPTLSNMYGVDVSSKLGTPTSTTSPLGTISNYLVQRYGFSHECKVSSFTGDNPATLAGLCLSCNDLALSLGTSDVVIGLCDKASPSVNGHVFVSPLDPNQHMFILCYKNGSLVREEFRDRFCSWSWSEMDEIILSPEPSNAVGIYLPLPEIIPPDLVGEFTSSDLTAHQKVQTLVEGQLLAKKLHLAKLGYKQRAGSKLVAVGGGAASSGILQTAAHVLNMNVYTLPSADVAAVGGAYLGYIQTHGMERFQQVIETKSDLTLMCKPDADRVAHYEKLAVEYAELERKAIAARFQK